MAALRAASKPQTATIKTAKVNSKPHGFAASVTFIDGENPEEFYGLQADLVHEFQPAAPTDQILVEKMAINHWLRCNRASSVNFSLR